MRQEEFDLLQVLAAIDLLRHELTNLPDEFHQACSVILLRELRRRQAAVSLATGSADRDDRLSA